MCMDLDIWFVTVCADGMNPGGCGGQDAGGPSEETKRKGEKKEKKRQRLCPRERRPRCTRGHKSGWTHEREKAMHDLFSNVFPAGGWPHQMARDHRPLHIPYY